MHNNDQLCRRLGLQERLSIYFRDGALLIQMAEVRATIATKEIRVKHTVGGLHKYTLQKVDNQLHENKKYLPSPFITSEDISTHVMQKRHQKNSADISYPEYDTTLAITNSILKPHWGVPNTTHPHINENS